MGAGQEHIGLSRNYDSASIKRKLLPAIKELEQRGFLQPMADQERYVKVCSGEWRVIFERARARSTNKRMVLTDAKKSIVEALVVRGVTPSTAEITVASYPHEQIQTQLEVFDWLVTRNDPKVSRNPAGFLISSIKSEYTPPKGFVTREERERMDAKTAERKAKAEERVRRRQERETAQQAAKDAAIETFWNSMSNEERKRLESEALAGASSLERDLIEKGGAFAATMRTKVLNTFALKLMDQAM